MLGKLARLCRSGNNGKASDSEDASEKEIQAPSICLPDTARSDVQPAKPEPRLAFPFDGEEQTAKDQSTSPNDVQWATATLGEGDVPPPSGVENESAQDVDDDVIAASVPEDGVREQASEANVGKGLLAATGSRALSTPRKSFGETTEVFSTNANPRLWRSSDRPLSYVGEVTKLNREVFTPTRPKRSKREFIGRNECVDRIVQAIEEERAHVILYGHKSVGKTSVLNIIDDSARQAGYLVARVMCTADLTFDALVRAIFEELSVHLATAPAGSVLAKQLDVRSLSELIESDVNDVPSALRVFARIAPHQVLVLLDDFHRIQDDGIKTKMRELMGALSDQGAWVSLVLSGRGDLATTFDFMQGDAPSGTIVFELGLMTAEEIGEIVEKGGARLGIQFDDDVIGAIIQLSQGLPVVVQWLGLLTARRALRNYAENVTMEDLVQVSEEVSTKVSRRLSTILDRLQSNGKHTWAGDLLFLAARTPIRGDGVFSTSDMSHEARRAVGRSFSELNLHRIMSQFCNGGDDRILEKITTADGIRYRFANPMMRAVVMLRNARRLDVREDCFLGAMKNMGALPSPDAI